jgi:tetratricopeptide (TPR) repeat protein
MTESALALNRAGHFESARVGIDPIEQVHLMENHDRSYHLWREADFSNRILIHIDAHHDMWWIDDARSLTIANFVCVALQRRIVREVYWVVPDATWQHAAGKNALAGHVKEILRSYPGGPAAAQWEPRRVCTSVMGCPLVICSLDTLPSFQENVLLDIDTDYLTIPRVSYRSEDVLDAIPWRSPEELTDALRATGMRTDFVTIAYSVEGGYTPLAWKYLGDELATRLRSPDQRDLADAYLRMRQGIVARLRRDFAQAEDNFRAVENRLGAAPHFHLAHMMAETDRPDEARQCYERALAIDPSYCTAYAGPGISLYRTGRDNESRAAFSRALQLNPADPYPHVGLGWIASRRKHWQEAEKEFRDALTLLPDLIDAHRGLGQALEEQGRSREAIEPYQQFLKLALRGHRPLNEVIATDPGAGILLDTDHGRIHASLARIYERDGDTKRATSGYRIAIAGGYDRVWIRLRLVRIYLRQRNWRQARDQALAALMLMPTAARRSLYKKFGWPRPAGPVGRRSQLGPDSHQMAVS